MVESEEHKVLEELRILLALERNYLAEERTAHAILRTGLALVLITVPATTLVSFVFSTLLTERVFLLDVVSFTVFAILAVLGVWMIFRSRTRLTTIKDKKRMLHTHEAEIIRTTKGVKDLLGKFIVLDECVDKDY